MAGCSSGAASAGQWLVIFLPVCGKLRKATGDGPDSLYLAAALSALMVVVCLAQSADPPCSAANPLRDALGMLANPSYLLFIAVQLVVSATVHFYFLGTGRFLQDKGVSGRNVSAAMGIAQATQAVGTILLLMWLINKLGYHWIFVIGALCWALLYLVYLASKWTWPLVVVQAFHGLAYMFFLVGGQKFVGTVTPSAIGGSAQSLIFAATTGIGFFLGAQFAGRVMERYSEGNRFYWPKIWAVPLAITLAGAIIFAAAFKTPVAADFRGASPSKQEMARP